MARPDPALFCKRVDKHRKARVTAVKASNIADLEKTEKRPMLRYDK